MLVLLDTTTAVLLLISMKRIYSIIRTQYSDWNPNKCFIFVQIVAFATPPLIILGIMIAYKPQSDVSMNETFHQLVLYCLF